MIKEVNETIPTTRLAIEAGSDIQGCSAELELPKDEDVVGVGTNPDRDSLFDEVVVI